ncbi:MAG TPA: energy-coupling factor transporter transmembrane component T [Solirubrobacteraceae bacterium]|nr:energy-coupling factor transporter transmembrane component T [Solirubrobacteraceae bacterium]
MSAGAQLQLGGRRASPLHSAAASAGCCYCAALALAGLALPNPLELAAMLATVLACAAAAGVWRPLARTAALAIPVGLSIAAINALVDRNGLTVIARLGDLPVLGPTDVTLEATVYGLVLGLRAMVLICCGVLYTLAVDPDEVLRLMRRLSFRSALTATIATRLIPMLARDGRRLAEAQRCRPGPAPSRLSLLRATCAGILDRALDVAAALEVRGYGAARRPPRRRRQRSRHDLAFLASAAAIAALVIAARLGGWASFSAYPALRVATGPRALALAGMLPAVALAPFAQRRGLRV